jgi:membrane protease YdiL (CAAX protease family)
MNNNLLDRPQASKNFSLPTYLLIVFTISCPFQGFVFLFPETTWAYKMLLVSMIMVTVGTYIAGRFVFKDTFKDAGWNWGKPKHYIMAFSLPILLWLIPTLLGILFGVQILPEDYNVFSAITRFIFSFATTLVPAFGEEFGWRGYLLPRLLLKHSVKKALIIQSFIWWLWHLPFLVFTGINTPIIEDNVLGSIVIILAVSIVPSMAHAIVFSYFWSVSSSLAVVTIYHAAFDEIRDTIEQSVGLSSLTEVWQMLLLTIIGTILLSKDKWKRLQKLKNTIVKA